MVPKWKETNDLGDFLPVFHEKPWLWEGLGNIFKNGPYVIFHAPLKVERLDLFQAKQAKRVLRDEKVEKL